MPTPQPSSETVFEFANARRYFFGMETKWVKKWSYADGRLWNDTRWKNFGQEAELKLRANIRRIQYRRPSGICLLDASICYGLQEDGTGSPTLQKSAATALVRPRSGRHRRYVEDGYVYHFRGGTLTAMECQNGHRDCALWQIGHRPDVFIGPGASRRSSGIRPAQAKALGLER